MYKKGVGGWLVRTNWLVPIKGQPPNEAQKTSVALHTELQRLHTPPPTRDGSIRHSVLVYKTEKWRISCHKNG